MQQRDMERFAFLYLCGQKDRAMLAGKKRMTFQDFDRLVYIADVLGLGQMKLEIWNQENMRKMPRLLTSGLQTFVVLP